MKEFLGPYPKVKHVVGYDRVQQALIEKDYEMAVQGIATGVQQIYDGELEISLMEIHEAARRLPSPWSEHPEVQLISCWGLINEGDYVQAHLVLNDLASLWGRPADGDDAELARQWMHFIRSAQGMLYDRAGQLELARAAFTEARAYMPSTNEQTLRPAVALEIDTEEVERLLTSDKTGLYAVLCHGLNVYQQNGDRRALARVAHNLGQCYLEQGRLSGARFWLERAWELKKSNPGRLSLAFTLNSLGICYRRLGLLDQAQDVLDRLLSLSEMIGSLFHQARALAELANVYRDREESELALDLYHHALKLKEGLCDGLGLAQTYLEMASFYRRRGDHSFSSLCLSRAQRNSYGFVDPLFACAQRLALQIEGLVQNRDDVIEELSEIVGQLHEYNTVRQEVLGRWYLALAHYQNGDERSALGEISQALEMALEHGHLRMLALELPVTYPLVNLAIGQGLMPEGVAGIVQLCTPQTLELLLARVPMSRAVVAATGRLREVQGLTAQMLEDFRLYRAGREVALSTIRSQKAISVLKLLVANRKHVISREQIFEAVWPEAELETADRSLDVILSGLRRLLDLPEGPSLIIRRGRGYTINPDISLRVDAEEFIKHWEKGHWWAKRGQMATAGAEWRLAEGLYAGDFLAEDLYEDWTTTERENLREKYLEILVRLGETALLERHYHTAIDRAQRVLAVDPLRETAYRLLMKAHTRLGDRAVALRAYRSCEETLFGELGEEPMSETRELADKIKSGQRV